MLEERAAKPFSSLDDFKARTHFSRSELRIFAETGALNYFAAHRRDALWHVEDPYRPHDLFTGKASRTASPLLPMNPLERLRADFSGLQLTTGPHPMALVRAQLSGILRATDLAKAPDGQVVRVAGNVICRQRPGTAKGFVFISLEDETGVSNAIVAPPLFERLRLVITQEPFLIITGRLQHAEGVTSLKTIKITALQYDHLVASPSHDFH